MGNILKSDEPIVCRSRGWVCGLSYLCTISWSSVGKPGSNIIPIIPIILIWIFFFIYFFIFRIFFDYCPWIVCYLLTPNYSLVIIQRTKASKTLPNLVILSTYTNQNSWDQKVVVGYSILLNLFSCFTAWNYIYDEVRAMDRLLRGKFAQFTCVKIWASARNLILSCTPFPRVMFADQRNDYVFC